MRLGGHTAGAGIGKVTEALAGRRVGAPGRTTEVKALARESATIFQAQRVHRETRHAPHSGTEDERPFYDAYAEQALALTRRLGRRQQRRNRPRPPG
jgi:hypothetical protein